MISKKLFVDIKYRGSLYGLVSVPNTSETKMQWFMINDHDSGFNTKSYAVYAFIKHKMLHSDFYSGEEVKFRIREQEFLLLI